MKSSNVYNFDMSAEFSDVRYSCWFVKLDSVNPLTAQWTVGVSHDCHKRKYSFLLSDLGDVKDKMFWDSSTSLDFAVNLLDEFRSNGEDGVRAAIKNKKLWKSKK